MMICKLKPSDLPAVMHIWLHGNLDAHPFVSRQYWLDHVGEVREQLQDAEVLVAERAGRVIGFAGLQGDYLAGIFVDQAARHQGVGHQLLVKVKRRHPTFTLAVYCRNQSAVDFYRHEGLIILKQETDRDTNQPEYVMGWRTAGSNDN